MVRILTWDYVKEDDCWFVAVPDLYWATVWGSESPMGGVTFKVSNYYGDEMYFDAASLIAYDWFSYEQLETVTVNQAKAACEEVINHMDSEATIEQAMRRIFAV